MMSLIKQDFIKGIVIKKIQYKDYHEIIHILTEQGNIESFFYENVKKNKKKEKISITCEVNISFFRTSGMNKIITLEIAEYFNKIISDMEIGSYINNILELISYSDNINSNIYKYILNIFYKVNNEEIDVEMANIYNIIKFLSIHGFKFIYKKTELEYLGYSFNKSMFVDYREISNFFELENNIVKLIYLLSVNDIHILEKIFLTKKESQKIFQFLNIILKEYLGIETKSSKKIIEIEEIINYFRRDND